MQKPEFKSDKDFILCTNTNFDIAELKENGIEVEEITDSDDFLDMRNVKRAAIRYKLIVNDAHELYEKLKTTSDLYVLAKALVEHICGKKQINLRSPIFQSYHTALIEEKVIEIEAKGKNEYIGKFHEKFISYNIQDPNNGPYLSESAKNLRKILQKYLEIKGLSVDKDIEMNLSSEFCKGLDCDPQLTNLEKFTQELVSLIKRVKAGEEVIVKRNKTIINSNIDKLAGHVLVKKENKVQCSLTFLDVNSNLQGNLEDFRKKFMEALNKEMIDFNTLDQYRFKIRDFYTCEEGQLQLKSKLPEDYIDNKEIKDFFDALVFAVNQPKEVELSGIRKDEIGAACKLIDSDLIAADIRRVMLDWFKEKGKEERTCSDEDGKVLLMLVRSTLEYYAKMENFGIEFTPDIINELQLHSFLTKDNRQIFILVTEHNTLSAIKLSQVLQEITEYKKDDSYLFIRLSSLLRIQERVIEAFKSESTNLLIIECNEDKSIEEKDIQGIQRQLAETINKKGNLKKKIVFIAKQENALTDLFKKFHNNYQERTDKKNSFTCLTTASQNKLLQECKVILQEYEISLNKLIDENSIELLDSTTLVRLINNHEVTIDHELISLGDTQNHYIPRTFNRQTVIKTEIFKEEKAKYLLAISDVDEARLRRLVPEDYQISLFQEYDRDKSNDIRSILLKTSQAAEQFEQLCQQYPALNIHWLKSESDQLIWQQSQGPLSGLRQYIEKDVSHTKHYSETELLSQTDQCKVVIISDTAGMGKTTVLTRLSQLFKQQAPDLWIVRIDLNNYTQELQGQKVESSFQTEDKAIAFLSDDILKLGTRLEQAIFKRYCQRIVLMLDGFDEISPNYREIVIDLVNVLRNGTIKQLWVTTRPNERDILEDELQQLSYKLEPFSKDNQVNFMTKFWQQTSGLSQVTQEQEELLADYAGELIDLLTKSIRYKDTELTGIPLQTRMLAEAFEKDFAELFKAKEAKLQLPEQLDLTDLYECFFKKKYHIQLEKNISQPNVKAHSEIEYAKFVEKHQNLALYTLFPEDKVEMLLREKFVHKFCNKYTELAKKVLHDGSNKQLLFEDKKRNLLSFINDIKKSKVSTGIIDQIIEDQPHFIHRTFAEYLVGKFLVASLDNETIVGFVLQEILLHPIYQVTRAFLNAQLPESLPQNTLAPYGRLIKRLWQSDKKKLYSKGMTLLHLAAKEGTVKIIRFFLNSLKEHETILKPIVEATVTYGYKKETALHLAAAEGYLDVVQWLVEHGKANVEATDKDGRTVLHYEVIRNKWDVVQWLVEHGQANVEATDNDGRTMLHYAARWNNLDVVQWLVEHGKANVEATDNDGSSVLHYAAELNKLDVIQWLVEHGQANVEATDNGGRTVLHYAAGWNKLDVFQWLVEHGKANVEATDNDGRTVLHYAARWNELDIFQWLVEYGKANVEATDNDGSSLLHYAAQKDKWDVVQWLVEHGKANVEATDKDGRTVLHHAVLRNKCDVVQWLVEHGQANVEATDNDGRTVLHYAARWNELDVVQWLVEHGKANVEATDNGGRTVLHYAAQEDKWDVVQWLVEHGKANVEATDNGGRTVLHYAAGWNKLDVFQWLVEHGKANVEATDNDGRTMLHYAARWNNLDVVQWLVEHGQANVEVTDNDGWTVLHNAAQYNNWDVVQWLVEHGKANVEATDNDGRTMLHYAARSNKLEVVQWLVEHGKASVEATDKDGRTLLLYAAYVNKLDVVQWLVEHGKANVEATDNDGRTMLHYAARSNKLEVVQWLVEHGKASVEATDKDGRTLLLYAAYVNKLDVVQWLVEHGKANVEATDNGGRTVLHYAAQEDKWDVVQWLVEHGKANVEATDKDGRTMLHYAARSNKLEVVQWLVEHGKASVEATDKDGRTLLLYAAYVNKLDVVQWLVEHGKANVEATDNDGRTMLHYAARSNKLEVVQWLVEHGKASVEATDKDGRTLLLYAAYVNKLDVVQWLVEHGKANVEATDNGGRTVLHYAAQEDKWDVVQWLVEHGKANVEATDNGGRTVLHYAAGWNKLDVFQWLVEHGKANVEATDNDGWSVLHYAARWNELDIVQWLVEYGKANVDATDNYGITVLNYAAQENELDVVQWLVEHGKANVEATDKDGRTVLHYAARSNKLEVVQWLVEHGKASVEATDNDGRAVLHYAAQENKLEVVQWLMDYGKANVL